MKYVTYPKGRFGNQLYFILNSYLNNHIYCINETTNKDDYKNDMCDFFDKLNLHEFYIKENRNCEYRNNYCNNFGKDFSMEQLELFISNTFLKSDFFLNFVNKIKENDTLCIHIRNCDYLNNPNYDIFNRSEYLQRAIEMCNNYNNCIVVTDNVWECKKYETIIRKKCNNIKYQKSNYILDFITLCSFKNKIIWNSTFSIWSSFISNCIYKNSYNSIIHPYKYYRYYNSVYNPMWISIKTIT